MSDHLTDEPFAHGDQVIARFAPHRTDDLRQEMVSFIGHVSAWYAAWIADTDEQFAGQWIFPQSYRAYEHGEPEIHYHVPRCDLEILHRFRGYTQPGDVWATVKRLRRGLANA